MVKQKKISNFNFMQKKFEKKRPKLLISRLKGLKKQKQNKKARVLKTTKVRFSKKQRRRQRLRIFMRLFCLENYSLLRLFRKKRALRLKARSQLKKKSSSRTQKRRLLGFPTTILNIYVRSNNLFINLSKYRKKKYTTIKFWSTGICELQCSKRKVRFIIYTMLKLIKRALKALKTYIIRISCASYLQKYLFKHLKKFFFKPKFFILNSYKIYNGCRSKKARRKKRLRYRALR